jgi:hypothetical protein
MTTPTLTHSLPPGSRMGPFVALGAPVPFGRPGGH